MTSNVGSRELDEYGSGVGFNTAGKNVAVSRKAVLEKAVKKVFPPEFINRVDEQVFFNPLGKEDIEKIINIEIKGLRKRVREAGFDLKVTAGARKLVAEVGYDPSYGARPLKRAIQRLIEDPVSEHIITERILSDKGVAGHDRIRVSLSKDRESTWVEWD
jgi:ATP-dependent Clp protease ATP-binding subunit ClpC